MTDPIFVTAFEKSPAGNIAMVTSLPGHPVHSFSLYTVCSIVWFIGVLGLLLVTGQVNRRFGLHVRNLPAIDDPTLLAIAVASQRELGLHRLIRLVESSRVQGPAIMGLFHSTLLLPPNSRAKFTDEDLRFIFLHEFAHLKRGDIIVQWCVATLQILHWFNPVLWYAFRRMRADREPATDAVVLCKTGEPEKYGRVLIKLLEHYHARHSLATLVGILEEKDQFKRRFLLIGQFTRAAYGWSSLGILLAGILSLSCLTKSKATETGGPDVFDPSLVHGSMSETEAKAKGIAALVNGQPILRSDLTDVNGQLLPLLPEDKPVEGSSKQQILQTLIDRLLVFQDFRSSAPFVMSRSYIQDSIDNVVQAGYNGDKSALMDDLKKHGMTWKQYEQTIAGRQMISYMRLVRIGLPVRRYYQSHLDLFPQDEKVNVSVIDIRPMGWTSGVSEAKDKSRAQLATRIHQQLSAGADFDSFAKKYPYPNYENGSSLWITKQGSEKVSEQLPFSWSEIEGLKPGQVSEVKSQRFIEPKGQSGYVILRVNKRLAASIPSTAETEKQKLTLLMGETQKLTQDWMDSLRAKAEIQVFDGANLRQ